MSTTPSSTGARSGFWRDPWAMGTMLAALVPIVGAIARHSGRRWMPIGDNALVEMRSRDVFSIDHFPFLGTWSSASLTAGKDFNHPGPLLFDLLAIPVRLLGGTTGVVVGVGLVNAAAIVGIAAVGYHLAGRTGSVLATLTAAALAHSMGSGMLTDPWNPHAVMLPCLLMCVLTCAIATGSFRLLPWLVATGSLCLQVHLGYSYLVPATCVVAVAGAALVHRRRWRVDPSCRAADVPAMWRTAAIAGATLLVLWAQPLIEQLTGDGQGNLARIATSTGSDGPAVGARLGARIVAAVTAVSPWWSRSSIVDAVPLTQYDAGRETVTPVGMPSTSTALAVLIVVALVLVGAGLVAHRRRDRIGFGAIATSAALSTIALATLVVMPIGPLGLTPHQMRWLWPIAAFTWFAVALVIARWATSTQPVAVRRALVPVAAALTALVVALNLPAFHQRVGPDTFQEAIPVARALADQVDRYRTDDTVVVDASGLTIFEPYSTVVMASLQRSDIDFRVEEPGLVRQVGDNREATGAEPRRIVLRQGRDALSVPDGMDERIALVTPLAAAEVDEVIAGEQVMVDTLTANGVRFTPAGDELIDAGEFGLTRAEIEDLALDPFHFVSSGLAADLVLAGAIAVPQDSVALFTRTSELRRRIDTTSTVAVLAGPN
ncbi:MAG: hypothetical protein AB7R77_15880 [Ilumatobacteraceae bacterium]